MDALKFFLTSISRDAELHCLGGQLYDAISIHNSRKYSQIYGVLLTTWHY